VLHTLKTPFSYIVSSSIDSDTFRHEFDQFLRAARVVKAMRTMRIGQIGQRIDFFWSTIVSEVTLLERFGIQTLPIDMPLFITEIRQRVGDNKKAYRAELAELEAEVDFSEHGDDRDAILYNFAFRDAAMDLVQRHNLSGLCVQSFSS